MAGIIFAVYLAAVATFVILCGGKEERAALAILVAAYLATFLVIVVLGFQAWAHPQALIAGADAIAFVLLCRLALRSKRFWPLPVAALHLIPILTPVIVAFGQDLVGYAVGVTQGLWSYLQLLILTVATIRAQRRRTMTM